MALPMPAALASRAASALTPFGRPSYTPRPNDPPLAKVVAPHGRYPS